jgi:hypothetical protein
MAWKEQIAAALAAVKTEVDELTEKLRYEDDDSFQGIENFDFDELSHRVDFLKELYDDLYSSEEELENEMDSEDEENEVEEGDEDEKD